VGKFVRQSCGNDLSAGTVLRFIERTNKDNKPRERPIAILGVVSLKYDKYAKTLQSSAI
jgi:hypothetical protein